MPSAHQKTLVNHLDHLSEAYCRPKLLLLLEKVNVKGLSDEQIEALKQFEFHTFPEVGGNSINFINGQRAAVIIKGIKTGRWSKKMVLAAMSV